VAELPGPHDLGTDPGAMLLSEGVIDATAIRFRQTSLPPLGVEHPFVQPFPGVTERCILGLPGTSAKAVERDGEVVNADE